jgi:hypothetical protein
MDKPFRGTIHHWAKRPMNNGSFYVIGYITVLPSDERFPQYVGRTDTPIRTSKVIKFTDDEIETRNSIYKLGEVYE